MTVDGQVLEGCLTPAYLVQRNPGGSRIATAPTGFQSIQGVQHVRPEVDAPTQTEDLPLEREVHVYTGNIIDQSIVTTRAEVYTIPTTNQVRPATQAETSLLGESTN